MESTVSGIGLARIGRIEALDSPQRSERSLMQRQQRRDCQQRDCQRQQPLYLSVHGQGGDVSRRRLAAVNQQELLVRYPHPPLRLSPIRRPPQGHQHPGAQWIFAPAPRRSCPLSLSVGTSVPRFHLLFIFILRERSIRKNRGNKIFKSNDVRRCTS